MSHRRYFSRILFCMTILLGSMAPSWGMDVPRPKEDINNDNNASDSNKKKSSLNRDEYIPLGNFHPRPNQIPTARPKASETREKNTKQQMYTEQFDEATLAEMKKVLEVAPPEAQQIVDHLKDKDLLQDGAFRIAVFWGPPGTGKTTTALAIAHEMFRSKGWKQKFFSSAALIRKHRNATAEELEKLFAEINADDEPNILIIDEMNELLENTHSEHHDTSTSTIAIINFLDGLLNRHHFFCIGMMNRIDKLAKTFMQRVGNACYEFPPFSDTKLRNDTFKRKIAIAESITDIQLNALLLPVVNCTGRDLVNIARSCKSLFRLEDKKSKAIIASAKNIEDAVAKLVKLRIQSKYDRVEETDTDRQERYHRIQCEQYEANKQLQTDLAKSQRDLSTEQFNTTQRTQERLTKAQQDQQRDQFEAQYILSIESCQYLGCYYKNQLINKFYATHYRKFPELRPANYRPLQESAAEYWAAQEALKKGKP